MADCSNTGNPRSCKGCGVEIHKLKFCTNECRQGWYRRTSAERDLARARERGIRPVDLVNAERRLAATRICAECGNGFIKDGGGNPGIYCSKPCSFAEARRGAKVRAERAVYARWARRARKPAPPKATGKACRDCGKDVPKHKQRCDHCRDEAHRRSRAAQRTSPSYRRARRAAKATRRAVERGIEAERFDPLEILARDGWRCHLCGVKTPKRLRGTFDDRAPELDHVIPLAAGGKHTRLNTACACRKCNREKGAEPRGQLRLVA